MATVPIRISEETGKKLRRYKGWRQLKTGERLSYDKLVLEMVNEKLEEVPEPIKAEWEAENSKP